MRVVFDTNVIITSLMTRQSHAATLIQLWEDGQIELLISQASFGELQRVVKYPKVRSRIAKPDEEIEKFITLIKDNCIFQEPAIKINLIAEDPTDNKYIELAVAGDAKYIVTGDQFILKYEQYQGIHFVTPAEFLSLIRGLLGQSVIETEKMQRQEGYKALLKTKGIAAGNMPDASARIDDILYGPKGAWKRHK